MADHEQATSGSRHTTRRVPPRMDRPGHITAAVVLLALAGLLNILATWGIYLAIGDREDHGQSVPAVLYGLLGLQAVFTFLALLSAILLWGGTRWARYAATALAVLGLISTGISLFTLRSPLPVVGIVLYGFLLRMLTHPDSADWCDRPRSRPWH